MLNIEEKTKRRILSITIGVFILFFWNMFQGSISTFIECKCCSGGDKLCELVLGSLMSIIEGIVWSYVAIGIAKPEWIPTKLSILYGCISFVGFMALSPILYF